MARVTCFPGSQMRFGSGGGASSTKLPMNFATNHLSGKDKDACMVSTASLSIYIVSKTV